MKLLITTQVVDSDDPILGFFVRWIEEFAKHYERIGVICLKEGKYSLPKNVHVYSLGKEQGRRSKIITALRFKRLAWKLRGDYDVVFVHMNPEYVIAAGLLWRVLGKRITLWYNHPHGGLRLWCAAKLAHRIFFTSSYAATAHLKEATCMPAGIDTETFKPLSVSRNRHSIYMQGRITPSKRVDKMLEALQLLRSTVSDATLTLVGPEDPEYGRELRKNFADLIASGAVNFFGPKRNDETPALYGAAGVSVNLAAAGHFDKSVLESMACGTPVVVSSNAFSGLVPPEWVIPEGDPKALAETLARLMALPEEGYTTLGELERAAVVGSHNIQALANALTGELADSVAS